MPIHNLGYREWDGERESGRSRWSVIAGIGIRRAWQSKWLRRIAFVVWGPPLAYGILIFVFEQFLSNTEALQNPEAVRRFARMVEPVLPEETGPAIADELRKPDALTPENMLQVVRPLVWKSVLLQLQRSQSIALIVVIGLIAPPLISQDVRSRAFLLYFSRPLTRLQYIAGKFTTVASFLLLTCTLPQLLLYLFAVLLSPDISVIGYTWDLPVRTIAASAVTVIPTTMLALMLSSMTTETRFASFGWFMIWIFGLAMYAVTNGMSGDTSGLILRLSFLFLLFSDLSVAVLGIPTNISFADTQFIYVAALTAVCFTVVFRKVSAPLRA